jgi:titin
LKWEVPEDDGGSPITGYIVEKKEVSRRTWQEAGKVTELTQQITKLQENNQYLFRVFAENINGVSEPVEIPEPVTAKNPFSELSHR